LKYFISLIKIIKFKENSEWEISEVLKTPPVWFLCLVHSLTDPSKEVNKKDTLFASKYIIEIQQFKL